MKHRLLWLVLACCMLASCANPGQKQMVDVLKDAGLEAIRPTVNKDGGLDFTLPGAVCTGTLSPIDVGDYSLWLFNSDGSRINQYWSFSRQELVDGAQTRHCFEPPNCPTSAVPTPSQ